MAKIKIRDIGDHLEHASADYLVEELESRGYIVIYRDFENLDDIIDLLERNGYKITHEDSDKEPIFQNKTNFKRFICDLFNLGYHSKKSDIIRLVNENLG